MRFDDYFIFTGHSIRFSRLRSLLTLSGIAVGIAAVVLLTALGEGAQQYVVTQFTQFGARIVAINPGKKTTMGLSGAVLSNVRPLTVEDADALRTLDGIQTSVPVLQGNAEVEAGGRGRWTYVFGVNHEVPETWQLNIASGKFLPDDPMVQARNLAVLGHRLKQELFPDRSPLGQRVRIGQERYRVVGVMERKGQVLGFDMDDCIYVPVIRAQALFNREGLMEIDLVYGPGRDERQLVERIRERLVQRHGDEDFTITTQSEMLKTLGSIMDALKLVVAALGGISLLVGGVGILTIMSIAVQERTREIGLLRAVGATEGQISRLFLLEASALAAVGGVAGMIAGIAIAWLLHLMIPALPVAVSWNYVLLAEGIAVITGLVAGLLPARRAAAMQPIEALRSE